MTHYGEEWHNMMKSWLHLKPWKPEDSEVTYSKQANKWKLSTQKCISSKISFKNKNEIPIPTDKHILKEITPNRSVLYEIIQESLQTKRKFMRQVTGKHNA